MLIYRAYRYELDPNNRQITLLLESAGAARFAWNWGLAERIRLYTENVGGARFISWIEQNRIFNRLKRDQIPWMFNYSKCIPQEALSNLDLAFTAFRREFNRARKEGRKPKIGHPRFKKKGQVC